MPPLPAGSMFMILSGSEFCHVVNNTCVTDGEGAHGSSEMCVVQAATALYASATYFQTVRSLRSISHALHALCFCAAPSRVQL